MLSATNMMSRRLRMHLIAACLLAVISCASYYVAYLLRFAGRIDAEVWRTFVSTVSVVVWSRLATMAWLGRQTVMNRYFTFHDLVALAKAVTIGAVVVTLVDTMLLTSVTIPRSVVLLDWGVTLIALAALNAVPRMLHDSSASLFSQSKRVRALIVGANDAGEGLLRALRRSPGLNYQPIGFVDDDRISIGRRLGGVPVLGKLDDIPALASRHNVRQVLLTSGELPGRQVRQLVDLADQSDFSVRVLPSYEQLLRQDVAVKPRDVAIGDLLRRPKVELNTAEVRQWVRGRIVMVTGSAGSIGSEIARQLLDLGPAKVVLLDRSETGQFFLDREVSQKASGVEHDVVIADLTDRERLHAVFQRVRPDIIFHAAAYKHVPLMEAHPGEAIKNIVLATRNVVDLAEEYEAEGFVMVSTDKAVKPTSVMGCCKRVAEQYVQAKSGTSDCRLVIVRFGNVLDSAGSVVPIFRQQIADGGPVTLTHPEMVRYFMLIPEAAQLVIQAGAMGGGGEVFVLDMGKPVRLMDLARDMIRLSGLREGEDIDIEIVGLRPGEKLYEELYSDHERCRPTKHEKIMVADCQRRELLEAIAEVNRLVASANGPESEIRSQLAELVPQYRPEASRDSRPVRAAA